MKVSRSIIKYIDIESSYEKVFDYLANVENWPQWAIVNMISSHKNTDGSFHIKTKFGEGYITISPERSLGILDHTWTDPQASWTVPCRLVKNNEGCTFAITLFQPQNMNDIDFDMTTKEMDKELLALKNMAEKLS